MTSRTKFSYNAALILQALAHGYSYGFDIMDFTGLASGTAYPILRRFETQKLVRSRWERDDAARQQGRPRRRYYELTSAGRAALEQALERFKLHQHVFGDPDASPTPTGRSR